MLCNKFRFKGKLNCTVMLKLKVSYVICIVRVKGKLRYVIMSRLKVSYVILYRQG